MKVLDSVVIGLFVIVMIVLSFLRSCSLDVYFLVFGFAIAVMSAVTMFSQYGSSNTTKKQRS